ncbi:MAG: GlsB/YeaQ/YmgE family stress response membrane protein [Chitinophagales bacterium]
MEQLIILLIVGAVAGWLANQLMKGRSMSLVWTVILGVAGAYIGNIVLDLVGIHASKLLGQILSATFGAVILLFIAAKIR